MVPDATPTDETLMAVLQGARANPASKQAALASLYQRWGRRVLATVGRFVRGDEALDVSQDVWLKVVQKAELFDGRAFGKWVLAIAANSGRDWLKKHRPVAVAVLDPGPDPGPQPLDVLLDRERQERLAHCLERLDEKSRALVRGRLGGQKYEELSPGLGLPMAGIYKRFHDALKALQKCMQEGER